MLDHLLNTARAFEREHGVVPDVISINPLHYEQLTRQGPDLFVAGSRLRMGFRLVIVPASVLAHPRASLLDTRHAWLADDTRAGQGTNAVAGWR